MKSIKAATAAHSNQTVAEIPGGMAHRPRKSARFELWIEPVESSEIVAGPFTIDDRSKEVFVESRQCKLSPKEYNLLKQLASDPGRVISTEEIITNLWPPTSNASEADVKQYVHLLRRRIERNPKQPRWIKNVRGFGYRLAVEPNATANRVVGALAAGTM